MVTYGVNALGQTTGVTASVGGGAATPLASNASYYPNGALKQFTYGNGIVHTMTQNARQLPSRSTDGTVLDLATAFDANGNVASVTDYTGSARQSRTLGYDGLDRLTGASSPMFGTVAYSYDAKDNLTRVWIDGGSQPRDHTYCYNATTNRLDFVRNGTNCASSPAAIALTYDVQGNLAGKNGTAYVFDYGNRLRSTAGLTYRYDADGRRVRQDSSGSQLKYSYYAKDGRLVWQRDEPAGKRINNVYFAGSLLSEISRPIGTDTATFSYFHTDALGSPIAKTNSAGTPIERSEYEPYGKLVNRANDDRAGYTGHVMDSASGLTYMQQRYYDPQLGLFLSVDPVTAYSNPIGQFHRYRYANNNPYKFVDPDGRAGRIIHENGRIRIETPMQFTGAGATPENTSSVTNDYESQSGVYSVNGSPTQVDFVIVPVTSDTPAALRNELKMFDGPTDHPSGTGGNYAESVGGTKASVDVNSLGFRHGAGHHEINHLVGAEDAYTRDVSGNKVPDPNRAGDIMNQLSGRMKDIPVNEIINHPNNEQIRR